MIVRSFVDTNVFIYADDPRDPAKQARATELVGTAMRSRMGVVSTQVLQEYFSTATRKLPLDHDVARRRVELIATMPVVQVDPPLILARSTCTVCTGSRSGTRGSFSPPSLPAAVSS